MTYAEIMTQMPPTPDDRSWKDYWRDKEKDKSHQSLTRQDKKNARRRFHKKARRDSKQELNEEAK